MPTYVIVWQYDIHPIRSAEFEQLYGPAGGWSQLFQRSPEYLGTQLLRDTAVPNRYITLDHWRTDAGFVAFTTAHHAEYVSLDRYGASLTITETQLGSFWRTAT